MQTTTRGSSRSNDSPTATQRYYLEEEDVTNQVNSEIVLDMLGDY